jgi:hypothetical protein
MEDIMTGNTKTGQTESDAYPDIAVRLGKLLEQYHATAGGEDALRGPALLVLSEVLQLAKENATLKEKGLHAFTLAQAACKFEIQVEQQVKPYLGGPPAEYGGLPNVTRAYDAEALGAALERMRRRHDQMEGALKPLAELSVPEDYIPDYFTDPDFYYSQGSEADTTDFFIRRMDIRRAREALGTYPRPEGYPFAKQD